MAKSKKQVKKKNIAKADKKHSKKMGNPKWVKGVSGNPAGRQKGVCSERESLREAMREVEKTKKQTMYERICERAFENDKMLIEVLKKFVPDMKYVEHTGEVVVQHVIVNYSEVKHS